MPERTLRRHINIVASRKAELQYRMRQTDLRPDRITAGARGLSLRMVCQ